MPKGTVEDASNVPPEVRAKIDEMVRRVVNGFHPEKIILFGSYARGEAGPDSDVDLLVVLQGTFSKTEEAIKIRMVLRWMGLSKDVVVATPEELEAQKDVVGTVIYPAVHEGKVLYERTA